MFASWDCDWDVEFHIYAWCGRAYHDLRLGRSALALTVGNQNALEGYYVFLLFWKKDPNHDIR